MKRKSYFVVALALAAVICGGTYAYAFTQSPITPGITSAEGDIATVEEAASQPDWDSVLSAGGGTETFRPDAAGTYSQCSAVGAFPNYACVDEVTADEDSTYVSTSGATQLDTYNIPDHSEGIGTITSVTVYIRTRCTTSGHAAEVVIRTNGTDYSANYTSPLPTSYTNISAVWNTNPNTGSAWTWGEVDALEIGVRQYDLGFGTVRTTQVWAEVDYEYLLLTGEVPTGDLFEVTPNPDYNGDLDVKVYLANTENLSKAYQYLNMKLYLEDSVEAGETPNYRLLTLDNGNATFTMQGLTSISGNFTQTSQADFEGGTPVQVDTTTSPGDVLLDTFSDDVTDTFDDATKIAASANVTVSGGQVKLIAGGASGTETLRPNAAGDETNITNQYPGSGAHWEKVDEAVSDDWSTYVYSGAPGAAQWYNASWQYRKKITIDYTKVSAALSNFPVLISLASDSDLAADAQDDGDDILFTSDNGTGKLSHEIEEFNGTTGELVSWVKVPSLSASANTTLYVYYGNATVGSQQDAVNVWDTNYRLVTHMQDDPDNAHTSDSTSNNNDGTKVGANQPVVTTAGQIDDAQDFDGSNDEVDHQNGTSLRITSTLTVSAWCKPDVTGTYMGILGKLVDGTYAGYALVKYGDNSFRFMVASAGSTDFVISNSTYADTNWHYIVATRVGGTSYLYVDGVLQTDTSTQALSDSGNDLRIGRQYATYDGRWWNGIVDEVRVSNTNRTTAWIATEYNNQNAPSSFYSLGGEEPATPPYERDLYNIPDHSTGLGNIDSVTVYFRFSGDSDGSNYTGYAKAAVKTHGTVYEGDVQSQTGKTFVTESHQLTTNPNTGSAWTWAEIDALQVGVSLRGQVVGRVAYCTQVYVEVNYTAYYPTGTLTSINLLSGEAVTSMDSFGYDASAVPSGAGLKVQFSQDNTNWYNSAGTLGGWDTPLLQGTDTIDLSGLGWFGANFYYKMEFTSDGNDTAVLDEITVNFYVYYTSGTLTSSDYDTGDDLNWDWGTISFTIDEPSTTDIVFQIRTAATEGELGSATWYGPTGAGDNYTSSGTAINSDHDGDRWIQYQAYFSGPGSSTPTLSDISITYSAAATSRMLEVIGGAYCLVSDDTSEWGTGWTLAPELYCEVTQR